MGATFPPIRAFRPTIMLRLEKHSQGIEVFLYEIFFSTNEYSVSRRYVFEILFLLLLLHKLFYTREFFFSLLIQVRVSRTFTYRTGGLIYIHASPRSAAAASSEYFLSYKSLGTLDMPKFCSAVPIAEI